jgi:ribose transport system substrate-binding protein
MTHRWKRWLAPGAAITAAALLAACSSGGSSSSSSAGASTSSSPSSSPAAGSSTSSGLALAQQMVTRLEGTTSSYPIPAASISGVSKLSGRTVYYIPLAQAIPTFVVAAETMKVAMAKAGLKLQVCDGQAQPSAIAACVGQAVAANAAGIILDAIPYGMAQNALDSAKSKGVPIVVGDQSPQPGTANTDLVTYVPGPTDEPSQVAWWMIADSQGKADAILAEEIDNPTSTAMVTNSLDIYTKYCPGCTIKVKQITATTNSLLASATSSNILSNPNADYYYTEFEDSLQPTIQGIQQSNRTNISLSVASGTVNGLGLLKSNSVVKAVVVADEAYEGWALTDELLRMATKSAPVVETIPTRLFTTQNIGSIQVTPAAQASGVWFGSTSFQSAFATLWGMG